MTSQLPPNLARLFMPRPPLKFYSACDRDPSDPPRVRLTGFSSYINLFKECKEDRPTIEEVVKKPSKKEERLKRYNEQLAIELTKWDPNKDEKICSDPYKTIFVSRMSYDTTEKQLRRVFEAYGPVKYLRIVHDHNQKSRGYAFVEFEREKDMEAAYRGADGMKLDNRRILVDVERSRTYKGWLPKRLGGGLGSSRSTPVSSSKQLKQPQEDHNDAWSNSSMKNSRPQGTHKGWRRQTTESTSPSRRYSSSHSKFSYGSGKSYRNNRYSGRSPSDEYNSRNSRPRSGSRNRGYRGVSPGGTEKLGYMYPRQRKRSPRLNLSRGEVR